MTDARTAIEDAVKADDALAEEGVNSRVIDPGIAYKAGWYAAQAEAAAAHAAKMVSIAAKSGLKP